jgi:hypothetical protein
MGNLDGLERVPNTLVFNSLPDITYVLTLTLQLFFFLMPESAYSQGGKTGVCSLTTQITMKEAAALHSQIAQAIPNTKLAMEAAEEARDRMIFNTPPWQRAQQKVLQIASKLARFEKLEPVLHKVFAFLHSNAAKCIIAPLGAWLSLEGVAGAADFVQFPVKSHYCSEFQDDYKILLAKLDDLNSQTPQLRSQCFIEPSPQCDDLKLHMAKIVGVTNEIKEVLKVLVACQEAKQSEIYQELKNIAGEKCWVEQTAGGFQIRCFAEWKHDGPYVEYTKPHECNLAKFTSGMHGGGGVTEIEVDTENTFVTGNKYVGRLTVKANLDLKDHQPGQMCVFTLFTGQGRNSPCDINEYSIWKSHPQINAYTKSVTITKSMDSFPDYDVKIFWTEYNPFRDSYNVLSMVEPSVSGVRKSSGKKLRNYTTACIER